MGGWGHVSSVKWTIHSLQWLSSIQQASPSPPYLCVVVYKVSTQFLQPQLISSDISRLSRARLPPADGISPTLHTLATGGCSKYGEYDNYIQQAPPVGTTKRNVDGHDFSRLLLVGGRANKQFCVLSAHCSRHQTLLLSGHSADCSVQCMTTGWSTQLSTNPGSFTKIV